MLVTCCSKHATPHHVFIRLHFDKAIKSVEELRNPDISEVKKKAHLHFLKCTGYMVLVLYVQVYWVYGASPVCLGVLGIWC